MKMEGWVKISREIITWEWYSNINVARVFFHLLLKANYTDKPWNGIIIKRGELVTSFRKLAEETSLSIQQTRTALNKLKSTQYVTQLKNSQHLHLLINNFDNFSPPTRVPTSKQHEINTGSTTTKKESKEKKEKKIYTAFDFLTEYAPQELNTLLEKFSNLRAAHPRIIQFYNSKVDIEEIDYDVKKLIGRLNVVMLNWDKSEKQVPVPHFR